MKAETGIASAGRRGLRNDSGVVTDVSPAAGGLNMTTAWIMMVLIDYRLAVKAVPAAIENRRRHH